MIKQISIGAVALGLATIAGGREANAQAPQVTVSQFSGLVGEAHFGSSSGCVLSFIHVVGVQNVTHSLGGPPVVTQDVTVEYTVIDFCLGFFTTGSGSGSGNIRGSLQNLSVQANVPVLDTFLGNTTVPVDVTFNGSGPPPTTDTTKTTTPTSFMVVHSVGGSVQATAAGSVVLDGNNLIAGLTDPAAHIDDVKTGTITITRP